MNSLKKSLGLQTMYQILVTLTPLIISPYISRTLGVFNLGIYSYTLSLVSYFMLLAMLGLSNYGNRTIAMASSEGEENKLFCEIYGLQLFSATISSVLYILFVLFFSRDNIVIFAIQSLWLLSCLVDVTWFFYGKKEFKMIITRNILVKIFTIILIFIFVKEQTDLWKYTLIMGGGNLFSQFILLLNLKTRINYVKPSFSHITSHIKPNILLFFPIVAISIYSQIDKTMLGLLGDYTESGYYYNADKIIYIPLSIVTGLGAIMLSSVSTLRSKGNDLKAREILGNSIDLFSCLSIGMSFGISAIANQFVPLFFGPGFESCVQLIYVLSFVMVLKTFSNIIRTQYLIPYGKERIYIIAVVGGATINFILNLILIFFLEMGALGACIASLIAEFFVCATQYIPIEKEVKLRNEILKIFPYLLFGIAMFLVVYHSINSLNGGILSLLIGIVLGIGVYAILSLVYWFYSKNSVVLSLLSIK